MCGSSIQTQHLQTKTYLHVLLFGCKSINLGEDTGNLLILFNQYTVLIVRMDEFYHGLWILKICILNTNTAQLMTA